MTTINSSYLTTLAFTSQITSTLPNQNTYPSKLVIYTPPYSLPKSSWVTKDLSISILSLETLYYPPNISLVQKYFEIFIPGFIFLPKD